MSYAEYLARSELLAGLLRAGDFIEAETDDIYTSGCVRGAVHKQALRGYIVSMEDDEYRMPTDVATITHIWRDGRLVWSVETVQMELGI